MVREGEDGGDGEPNVAIIASLRGYRSCGKRLKGVYDVQAT